MNETERLDDYIIRHIDPESDYLHRLYRATNLQMLYGRMASGHIQGRLLKMLVTMVKPRYLLEIGTFSGYSTLCLAEGLEEGSEIHTVEINDEQEPFTRPWFDNSPLSGKIKFHIGDAMDIVPQLGLTFDMVFIDADKRRYVDFYEMVMPHLRSGGYILADNTLWDGHVINEQERHEAQTLGIMTFNDRVAADNRVEKVIVPIRDGLTIIRKIK